MGIKRAKEELETWLRQGANGELSTKLRYKKANERFASKPQWTSVPDDKRKEIFEDVIAEMREKEKVCVGIMLRHEKKPFIQETESELRKRNIKTLSAILDTMDITYETQWAKAQGMLLSNSQYLQDTQIQGSVIVIKEKTLLFAAMDPEDALIVFKEHILVLEKEDEREREATELRKRRLERNNREQFRQLLAELHAK